MKRGFICGVFDLFHYGHLLALKVCREHCDYLVVAVNKADNFDPIVNPGKNKPIFPLLHRVEILKSCRFVDEVVVYGSESELSTLLSTQNYDIRFLGEDYRNKPVTGGEYTPELYFLERSHGFSTSMFRNEIRNQL